jgi:hypothetical protein
MPLRNEDKDWIHAEIKLAIDTVRPHGWKKLAHWLREWGIIGTNITIIFALLAMTLTAAYYAFSRVSKEATFEANTATRLDTIEATLKLIPGQIAAAKYSSVPLQELKKHRDELKEIKDNLATANRSTLGFWPVSFQIINLLSEATSSPAIQKSNIVDNISGPPNSYLFENVDVVLKNLIAGATFRNAIVRFDPSARLVNDTFINCVFIFPVSMTEPPKPLQDIAGRLLMASDLSKVSIGSS